ncbi:97_t:CDS:2, partial [Dentiscutata erythropus]
VELRDSLLADLEKVPKNEELSFHEKKGDEFLKKSMDYRNACEKQWDKLSLLKKEDLENISSEELKDSSITIAKLALFMKKKEMKDLENISSEELKDSSITIAKLAYGEYKIACETAERDKILSKSRKKDLLDAKDLFDEVSNSKDSNENTFTSKIMLKNNSNNVTKTVDQSISLIQKRFIKNSISKDIARIISTLRLKADSGESVLYHTLNKGDLLAKDSNSKTECVAITAASASATVIKFVSAVASCNISPVFLSVSTKSIGVGVMGFATNPIITTITTSLSLIALGLSIAKIKNQSEIHKNLCNILGDAYKKYHDKDYQELFKILERPYKKNEKDACLFKLCPKNTKNNIINTLLDYGVSPECIAGLLCLIGSALVEEGMPSINDRGTRDNGMKDTDFLFIAKGILLSIIDLENEIKEFYKRKNGVILKKAFNKVCSISFDAPKPDKMQTRYIELGERLAKIIPKHLGTPHYPQNMSVESKLEMWRNFAKLHLALLKINLADEEAKQYINEVRKSTENSQPNFVKPLLDFTEKIYEEVLKISNKEAN